MEQAERALVEMNPWWKMGSVPGVFLKEFKRDAYFLVRRELAKESNEAILILGPRRVGKTVVFYQVIDLLLGKGTPPQSILYITFDNPRMRGTGPDEIMRWFSEAVNYEQRPGFLFFDEIQYLDDWDRWLKYLVDRKMPYRILATGSATVALKKGKRESGVGRWKEIRMFPMSFAEFVELKRGKKDFALLKEFSGLNSKAPPAALSLEYDFLRGFFTEYLLKGGFPEGLDMEVADAHARIRDTIDRVIYKDISALGGIREPLRMEALFHYLLEKPGGLVNKQSIASEIGLPRPTLDSYIRALEDSMLITRIPPILGKHKKQDKIYPADPGLLATARHLLEPIYKPEIKGQLLETAVCANMAYYAWHKGFSMRYWRSKKSEVDFVLTEAGEPVMAVEAKSGGKLSGGIREFHSKYPNVPVRVMSLSDIPSREQPMWLTHLPAFVDLFIGTNEIRKELSEG